MPHAGPTCLDAHGNKVDWWVALKLPGSDSLAFLDSRTAQEAGLDARLTVTPQR